MIRPASTDDAPAITGIYNHYVKHSNVTFEEEPVSINEMESRIPDVTRNYPWLVFEQNDTLTGYTYATQWKPRAAYRHTVETAIYVDKDHSGNGIGSKLIRALIEDLKSRPVHAALSGIVLPNQASVALYEKFGFQKVAHFKETGFKFNKWLDVGYWQLLL
jgi:L-amino acid N-acyltransferase YncA